MQAEEGDNLNQSEQNNQAMVDAGGNSGLPLAAEHLHALGNQSERTPPWPFPASQPLPTSTTTVERYIVHTPRGASSPNSEGVSTLLTRETLHAQTSPYARSATPFGTPSREVYELKEMNRQLRREAQEAGLHQVPHLRQDGHRED